MTDHSHDDHGGSDPSGGLFDHYHPEWDDEGDERLDAANQSLADALKASFRILKWVMVLLVFLYLGSGIEFIEPNEEAVVLRLGRLLPTAYQPGPLLAWPFPIDEVIRLPVKEASEITIDSHMLGLTDDEKRKGLKFVSRGHSGLDPNRDGALLTGDTGLVHVQWVVTFKISSLPKYIENLDGKGLEAAESLVQVVVEKTAVEVAAGMETEDVYRRRVDELCTRIARLSNERLTALNSGIKVVQVKAPLSFVPVQIRDVFDRTQSAENEKDQKIQQARKQRTEILSEAAGRSFEDMLVLLNDLDRAQRDHDVESAARVEAEVNRMLRTVVAGQAGEMIKQAGAHYARVVGQIESDLDLYRRLLPEYAANPTLLFERMWDETRREILSDPDVTKIYRPFGLYQMRIRIGPDPKQAKAEEVEKHRRSVADEPIVHFEPLGPE